MTTGRRAFGASSQAGAIGAILHTVPPSMQSLNPATPGALDRAVARCPEKNPENRWQPARDLKRELEPGSRTAMRSASARLSSPSGRAGERVDPEPCALESGR
jgi:hypothetical protein